MTEPLATVSTVDALVAALRRRILDGELLAGTRLVERELTDTYAVARHTVRAALRELEHDGLVQVVPNRGAQVADPQASDLTGLFELRTALEVEAARLALARHPGELREALDGAARDLRVICDAPSPPWSDVADGHDAVHRAIVAAAVAPRIAAAHAALVGEMRLFLIVMRPVWTLDRMAAHHEQLARELPRRGPDALREHLADGAASVLAAAPDAAG